MSDPSDPSVRVLGPVELWAADGPVPVGGPLPRALLAVLALRANAFVDHTTLAAELWGRHLPADVPLALRSHVSRLRARLRTLGNCAVTARREHGYRLEVARHAVDAHRFDELARSGHTALRAGRVRAAAASLGEARSIWRGRPFADTPTGPLLQVEQSGIEERYLTAVEDHADARLLLENAATLVPDLERFAAAHPLRERACAQLMLARYRSGQQAEALAAYHAAREHLAADLGIEPGPLLREVEWMILHQRLDLAATTTLALQERTEQQRPAAAPRSRRTA